MKRLLLPLVTMSLTLTNAPAQTEPHPTGPRITPPTLNVVAPRGISRGTTVEMTVEGLNLARAHAIYFDSPGLKGRIVRVKELPDLPDIRLGSNGTPSTVDLGPLPPRNQVTVEVDVSPQAAIGPVNFRLHTPLGTTAPGTFLVEPYYGESPDREPNDTFENAFETYLPSILVGEIARAGDVDHFKIQVKAGEELVFENGAMLTGSTLQPVVSILREDHSVAAEFGADGGPSVTAFAHKFDKPGTYYIRVADYQQSGRSGHTYRIKVGGFPLATSVFPLGLQKGTTAEVALRGYRLGSDRIEVKGEPSPGEQDLLRLRPKTKAGLSFSEVKLAIGTDPEVLSTAENTALARAQRVSTPVTVNGRIAASGEAHYFRFAAKRGETTVLEVNARRLDSDLDSAIEVLDAAGKPIEVATVRSVVETFTTLRDHDSAARNMRLQSITGLKVGDWMMIGGEIGRLEALPRTPDDDIILESFAGQRLTFFGTSAETHAVDKGIYKVQILPPGTQLTPNGLPIVRLYARNDDGGPGFGKDSRLEFTAPADGEYIVCIRDVRGMGGENFAYRLSIRPRRPDFRLAVAPRNPNVPLGGSIPLTVTALRLDGFDGKIDVVLEGLPKGLTATPGVIGPGQVSTTVLLSAAVDAKLNEAAPLRVAGKAAGS
ncbi:MAG TPA: hypothetical protein VHN20_13870, partial [Beijerinckiaceae bacterium]|nr:hypothetical protein [Beijerinckiaceae bacterium]